MVAAASDAGALGKLDWQGMAVETYTAAYNESEWRAQAAAARFKDPVQGGLEGIRMWGAQCDLLLSDAPLLARLKVGAPCLCRPCHHACPVPGLHGSDSWKHCTDGRMHADG